MKGKKRHEFFYIMGWHLLHRLLARKFNFDYDNIKVEYSPYIVVANHLTNWDPLLAGLSFRKPMYYVASDHILRKGFISKLLKFAVSPIARVKTAQETQTVISIFRRLKENCNICIFAEGATSFDGETGEMQPSIGKLIKRSGVALVTYRFKGSYLTFPRWARFPHRGKMQGRLVQIYSPEKIASMSEEEIYIAVKNDIYINAYDEQEKNPIAFKGKKTAECLETVLYCCPKCRLFGTLKSRGDILSCTCGFKVRYNEYCYFEIPESGERPPFKTIFDWVKWERNEIKNLAQRETESDIPVTEDDDQELYEIIRASKSALVAKGKLCMYRDRLSVIAESGEKYEFALDKIIDMSVITMKTIVFAVEHKIFEIHSKRPRSALKYTDMHKIFSTKK
ncbi:MAG: 1-acyl-sn-glycerol-3-phosphate acyltransferase [Treponema sp.]|nr:1-acyl-sn-glycerol-3-phosphate acyltransferase [Treponema sp.]